MVDSLPNAKGYIRLGPAKLTHNLNGFYLEGNFGEKNFRLSKEPLSMYSCHIEYDYLNKGDCIDLSTLEDTYYMRLSMTGSVTGGRNDRGKPGL